MIALIAYAADTAHEATQSSGGIGALGLDIRALLFQILNFAILLGLLRLFAYKPILNVLNQRRQKIEEGLATADQIAKARAALEQEKKAILTQAQQEALALVTRSEDRAKALIAQAEADNQQRREEMVAASRAQAAQEIATVREELKREITGLVVQVTEKVLDTKLDDAADAALIERHLASVTTEKKNL